MHFNVMIIGGGPGGYTAAFEAAKAGLSVCLIEEREVGGTCLNRGCIPTKTFVHTADLYRELNDPDMTAIDVESFRFNTEKLLEKKNRIVTDLRAGIEKALKSSKITVMSGKASLTDAHTAHVNGETVTADHTILATGSIPSRIPVEGADLPGVITSDDVLETLPLCKEIVIVGGGVIGCEMAGIYEAAGTKVIILEALDRLLPNMESELGRSLALTFKKRGIEVHAKTFLKKIEQKESRLRVSYEEKGALNEKECDLVLLAAGRKAVTDVFEGETPVMERGRFAIDESCMTSIPDLYAIGDCAGSYPQLAHTAMAMAVNAVCAITGKKPERDMNVIPSGVYTSPEIAACGLTEKEAQEKGYEVFSAKANTMANARSLIASGERGFTKLTVEKGSGKLLGAFMMCERATDLIHEAALAVHQEMTVPQVLNMIHGHPTFSEVFVSALEAAEKKLG